MAAYPPKYSFALWSTSIITSGYFEIILGGSFHWNTHPSVEGNVLALEIHNKSITFLASLHY